MRAACSMPSRSTDFARVRFGLNNCMVTGFICVHLVRSAVCERDGEYPQGTHRRRSEKRRARGVSEGRSCSPPHGKYPGPDQGFMCFGDCAEHVLPIHIAGATAINGVMAG